MFLKSTTSLSLFLLITLLAFSHIALVRCADDGAKVTATFNGLSGTMTITQTEETIVQMNGKFDKGFTDTDPENYTLEFVMQGRQIVINFRELGATITPPGTTPYDFTGNAFLEDVAGPVLSIILNGQILDQAIAS